MVGTSSIDRLPAEVRKLISGWFDGGCTVDEVTEHLREMGAPVSRSAVGRKRKEWGQIIEQVREARASAEVLARTFRDAPASEVAQANIEMLHTLMLRTLRANLTNEEVTLKASELMFLTKAISSLTGARKAEVDTTVTAIKAAREPETTPGADAGGVMEVRFVAPDSPVGPEARINLAEKPATDARDDGRGE